MDKYQAIIALRENKAPALISAIYNYPLTIIYTFDEDIKGTSSFKVLQDNTELISTSVISGKTITITLGKMPTLNALMQIIPTQFNTLTDLIGNTVSTSSVLTRYINATP